jgi:hypothetical protein
LDIVAEGIRAVHVTPTRVVDAPRFERCKIVVTGRSWTRYFADKQASECGYALIQRLRQVTFSEDIAI